MTDLTVKISGLTGKDGDKPKFISTENEHQQGVLAFTWGDSAEAENRYSVRCECYGNWGVIKFAAVLNQMRSIIGDEIFEMALMGISNIDKYKGEEDKQYEQDGVD